MGKSRSCRVHPDRMGTYYDVDDYYCYDCCDQRSASRHAETERQEEEKNEEFREAYLNAFGKYPEGYNP